MRRPKTAPCEFATTGNAPDWDEYTITDERLIAPSDDRAVLVYTGRERRAGNALPFVTRMSSVYVCLDGSWRLARSQQTPVAEGP